MTVQVFSVPVFFIVFREALETVVVVSVLLAFLKQSLAGDQGDPVIYKRLVRQVWWGVGIGALCCLCIGAGIIAGFYKSGVNSWANTEDYWEAAFSLFATIIITIMGAGMLRVSKMQDKWRVKIAQAMRKPLAGSSRRSAFKRWCEKYAMFILPLITVLREGMEGIVFVSGVTFSAPATSVPLPIVIGLVAGVFVGWLIYKGGATSKLQYFLVGSTMLLYLVAAGLFSRAVWSFEMQAWVNVIGGDLSETGSGAGSYDISKSVWHVAYGNPELNGGGGWGIFNAILGWTNSATYGSVISYNVYWIAVIAGFLTMRYQEVTGHWPGMRKRAAKGHFASDAGEGESMSQGSDSSSQIAGVAGVFEKKGGMQETVRPTSSPARSIEEA